jgi:hypothetical protein
VSKGHVDQRVVSTCAERYEMVDGGIFVTSCIGPVWDCLVAEVAAPAIALGYFAQCVSIA